VKYLVLLVLFLNTSCSSIFQEVQENDKEGTVLEKYREERNAGRPAGHEVHCRMTDIGTGGIATGKDMSKSLCH